MSFQGEEVEYEVTTGPKGFQAANVTGPGGRAVMGDPKVCFYTLSAFDQC